MVERRGAFRFRCTSGRVTVRYDLRPGKLSVRVTTLPDTLRIAWRLRLAPSPSFRWAARQQDADGGSRRAGLWYPAWDLQARPDSLVGAVEPFQFLISWAGYGEKEARTPSALAHRHFGLRLVARLAREAFERTDPHLRALAQQTHPWRRFWLYRQLAIDGSGRVLQMARTCHGLLVLAHAAHARGGAEGKVLCQRILSAIVAGERLPSLLRWAVAATFEPPLRRSFCPGLDLARLAGASPREAARLRAARRLLVRGAGPLLSTDSLRFAPPSSFAPEDIPTDPHRNELWFRSMGAVGVALEPVTNPRQREALSAFVSAHERLVLGWFQRRHRWDPRAPNEDPGSIRAGVQRLLRFAGATGRWPTRAANPRKFLAACDAWTMAQQSDSPAGRLGQLLRRLAGLGLGDVVSVSGTPECIKVDDVLGATLPPGPIPNVLAPRLQLAQIRTPEALAREGAHMRHCIATYLPQVLSGDLAVYAGTVAGERLTVALSVGWHGTVEILEARRRANLHPTVTQWQLLRGWLASPRPAPSPSHLLPG